MKHPPISPFRWRDLPGLGISQYQVRRWLAAGLVRRPLRGVYCSTRIEDSIDLRVSCLALVMPERGVLCDRTAAWLWGIDVLGADDRFCVPEVEVVARRGSQPMRRSGVYPGVRDLWDDDVVEIRGVATTTPARTALDLACLYGRWRALAALDAFMRHSHLEHDDFYRLLPRYRGRRGVTQLRELIPLAVSNADSPMESWTRCAVIDSGLAIPETQIELHENGILVAVVDLGYRHLRIGIEFDGEEFHGPEHQEHDDRRREWLESQGWQIIVVRKRDLRGLKLQGWLAELRRAIQERNLRGKRVYARRPGRWAS